MKFVRVAVPAALVAPVAAFAQSTSYIPAGVSGMFTQLTTDLGTLMGYAVAAGLTIIGSLIAWKYGKKLANKV